MCVRSAAHVSSRTPFLVRSPRARKLISLNSFTTYVSDETVTALLRRQKVYAAAFTAANKD